MTGEAAGAAEDDRPGWFTGRRLGVLVAVAAALLGLAAGYATGVFTTRASHPADDSAEAGFARDMLAHHSQAVEMAMIAYQRASRPELRRLAYDMALTQQSQRGMMTRWLDEWGLSPTSSDPPMSWMPDGQARLLPDGRMPGMASQEDLDRLRSSSGPELDVLFCQLMIQHHLGGIHMVDGVLAATDRREVREFAESMKAGQQFEINAMRDQLTRLGARP